MMDTEKTLRRDVALANRILERSGLSTVFGHASARIPGTDTFLLPARRSPRFAEEDSLLVLDTNGTVLSGEGVPNSELWIHARAYAVRADLGGIVPDDGDRRIEQVGEREVVESDQCDFVLHP